MNDELRTRGDDLNSANAFLQSVLASLRGGVAVVDQDFRVIAWNEQAEDLWGLRESEVNGQHFLNLDIGLPVDQLRTTLRKCMQGESEEEAVKLRAINRRGKTIHCQVTCTPLRGPTDEIRGAILHMEDHGDGKP